MSAAGARAGRVAALAGALSMLAFAAPSGAATVEVTTTEQTGAGSLGLAILEASPGDTLVLGPGEYTLVNGDYLIAKELTLRGAGAERTTIVPSGGGEALDPEGGATVIGASVAEPLQGSEVSDGSGTKIETKAQIIALLGTIAFFLLILDLVRRRRLVERYALLWMSVAIVLLVLAVWTDGLDVLADAMGIAEPANAIFLLSLGSAFLLLLNFSVATSRLSEETKILAQETGRLEQELRAARGEGAAPRNGEGPSAASEQAPGERPVEPQGGA